MPKFHPGIFGKISMKYSILLHVCSMISILGHYSNFFQWHFPHFRSHDEQKSMIFFPTTFAEGKKISRE